MNETSEPAAPTAVKLHKKSRLLEISFSDDSRFLYPCEYLRVSAPAVTGEQTDGPIHGKSTVGITQIEPLGTAALRLDFDDGYSADITWEALHTLGADQEHNWKTYLQDLEDSGLARGAARATGEDGRVIIRLLYFIQLAQLTGSDEEEVAIPDSVTNVETLLAWLSTRRQEWREAFTPEKVQVTVNRHFAEPFTLIEHGDEVALVPRAQ